MGLSKPSFTVKSARQEPRPPSTTGISGDWLASKPPQRKRKSAAAKKRLDHIWPNRILLRLPGKNHTPVGETLQFFLAGNFTVVALSAMRSRSRIIGVAANGAGAAYDHRTGPVDSLRKLRAARGRCKSCARRRRHRAAPRRDGWTFRAEHHDWASGRGVSPQSASRCDL